MLINSLQPFMFYDKNINGAKDYLKSGVSLNVLKVRPENVTVNNIKPDNIKPDKVIEPIVKKVKEPMKESVFYPREEDSLFWCFYLMKNGHSAYELIENRNIVTEMKFKIEYIDKLRKNKKHLKTHSHKFETLAHLEGSLSGSKRIDMETFITLCFLEQINIMVINKSTFYQLFDDSENETEIKDMYMVCKDTKTKRYGYKLLNKDEIENYRNKYYHIENIIKPIKAVSAYKVDELVSICEKLSVSVVNDATGKRKTKQDMYESLVQYFS